MIPLYVASRASLLARPRMWQRLRAAGWNIISTWIDECGPEETKCFRELWTRIEREIQNSAGLIFYAEPVDFPLKGAYVEVGIALGMGKPVAVVIPGVTLDYPHVRPVGSWINHPRVKVCSTLTDAHIWLTSQYTLSYPL